MPKISFKVGDIVKVAAVAVFYFRENGHSGPLPIRFGTWVFVTRGLSTDISVLNNPSRDGMITILMHHNTFKSFASFEGMVLGDDPHRGFFCQDGLGLKSLDLAFKKVCSL